jgi:hypothetical protein
MSLVDEVRMDRPVVSVVTTETPSLLEDPDDGRAAGGARIPPDFKEFLKSLDAHNARRLRQEHR